MKIYLLRHGTTNWNTAFRIQGRTDIPLDEAGEAAARLTGEALLSSGITFARVFSSPLQRAFRTAQLAAPGAPVTADPRLTELGFGDFEGRSVGEMMADENCPFRHFQSDPVLYNEELQRLEQTEPEKGYESLSSLCARTGDFVRKVLTPMVLSGPADARVLIAGHGAMNRGLMTVFLHAGLGSFWGSGLSANCGIYLIDAQPSPAGGVVYQSDDVCHIFYDPDALPKIPGLLG